MCGRFSIATEAEMLAKRFNAALPSAPLPQRFNAAPSQELPIILKKNKEQEWLLGLEDTTSTLEPVSAKSLDAYEISPLINNPRNNTANVLEPIPSK